MTGTGTCPRKDILLLFDVDGTLTPSRQNIDDEMHNYLQSLRKRVHIGLVGGSDLKKIAEQTLPSSLRTSGTDPIDICVNNYDYVFAENGLVAYHNGKLVAKQSLINHLGEKKIQKFINFCLGYMSKLTLPVKRGNFIEFRNGLINVCPVGRSCSQSEREQFNAYDREHSIRKQFIRELEKNFGPTSEEPLGLVYSIGGQISFDAFPKGWDKTFSLGLLNQNFEQIYFFGDQTHAGGNDHEIFEDPRTIGKTVKNPSDTLQQLAGLGF
jgi:phosphomannomutase